jgi:hypothetical protein
MTDTPTVPRAKTRWNSGGNTRQISSIKSMVGVKPYTLFLQPQCAYA